MGIGAQMLEVDYRKGMEAAYDKHAKEALASEQISQAPDVDLKKGLNEAQKIELNNLLKLGMNVAVATHGPDVLGKREEHTDEKSLDQETQKAGLNKAARSPHFVKDLMEQRGKQTDPKQHTH